MLVPGSTECLVVVKRDQFAAFALLAQTYAGEPGVRLVWDRRRHDRRGTGRPTDLAERRRGDRRAHEVLDCHDYVVFAREQAPAPTVAVAGGPCSPYPQSDPEEASVEPVPVTGTAGDDIRREIDAVAQSDFPTLITGGDTMSRLSLARRLHDRSRRGSRPFRVFDRQAFVALASGWLGGRAALGDLVGGTAFIGEIGDATWEEQSQFSELLERFARRRDAAPPQTSAIRLIAASGCGLVERVRNLQFRTDLFYRLNMVHLVLPPGLLRPMT
jgi:transcriptional regulator of acetoin/glycerol metabolism